MAKAKTSKDASKNAKAAAPEAREEGSAEHTDAPSEPLGEFGKRERAFLTRVSRFLLGIASRPIFVRAAKHGYSEAEHQLGWSLYRTAMGEKRSLDTMVATTSAALIPKGVLQPLDAFENLWFPRVTSIIRRFAPKASRAALETAFFDGLVQQPLGPGVVGSVSLFLKRVDELNSSKLEGAAKVRAVLAQRGLDDQRVADVRALLARAQTPAAVSDTPSTEASTAAREQAQLATQHEALAELRLWRQDWRATLEPEFTYRERIQLGLLTQPGGRKRVVDEGDEDEDEDEDDPADGETRRKS